MNRYAYARNNPWSRIDPDGHQSTTPAPIWWVKVYRNRHGDVYLREYEFAAKKPGAGWFAAKIGKDGLEVTMTYQGEGSFPTGTFLLFNDPKRPQIQKNVQYAADGYVPEGNKEDRWDSAKISDTASVNESMVKIFQQIGPPLEKVGMMCVAYWGLVLTGIAAGEIIIGHTGTEALWITHGAGNIGPGSSGAALGTLEAVKDAVAADATLASMNIPWYTYTWTRNVVFLEKIVEYGLDPKVFGTPGRTTILELLWLAQRGVTPK